VARNLQQIAGIAKNNSASLFIISQHSTATAASPANRHCANQPAALKLKTSARKEKRATTRFAQFVWFRAAQYVPVPAQNTEVALITSWCSIHQLLCQALYGLRPASGWYPLYGLHPASGGHPAMPHPSSTHMISCSAHDGFNHAGLLVFCFSFVPKPLRQYTTRQHSWVLLLPLHSQLQRL